MSALVFAHYAEVLTFGIRRRRHRRLLWRCRSCNRVFRTPRVGEYVIPSGHDGRGYVPAEAIPHMEQRNRRRESQRNRPYRRSFSRRVIAVLVLVALLGAVGYLIFIAEPWRDSAGTNALPGDTPARSGTVTPPLTNAPAPVPSATPAPAVTSKPTPTPVPTVTPTPVPSATPTPTLTSMHDTQNTRWLERNYPVLASQISNLAMGRGRPFWPGRFDHRRLTLHRRWQDNQSGGGLTVALGAGCYL